MSVDSSSPSVSSSSRPASIAAVSSLANWPPWLPLPTNTVQNLADILLEVCRVLGGISQIDETNLICPWEAVKCDSIRVRTEEFFNALPGYSAVLRSEPASLPPTANLPGRHMKKGSKSVGRVNRQLQEFRPPYNPAAQS